MVSGRLACASALVLVLATPSVHATDHGECRVVELSMTPTEDLQMVVWIEDAAGNYVDTAYITRLTGSFGLGNRPGIMEFNSGPLWPYGRRVTTFPVWAHRHGLSWPLVVFQDGDDDNLSHPITKSSIESFYCRPIRPEEEMWDANSCATTVYTDKGLLSAGETSLYPPRSDLLLDPSRDDDSVSTMAGLNPFDAVSRATPVGGAPYQIFWPIPTDLPEGQYVAWVEVSREFDHNDTYDEERYPSPMIAWGDYGIAYRGQPSVLYRLEFSISGATTTTTTLDYVGYGDPDGIDGEIREPDATITSDVAGSGSSRLLLTAEGEDMFRIKLVARTEEDEVAPGGVGQLETRAVTADAITASFIAPGDDDQDGLVSGYEVRYRAGTPITDDNFAESTLAPVQIDPAEAGAIHSFTLGGLLPNTNYYVGVRAVDECVNAGPVVAVHVQTPRPEPGSVDACFVATAAYGSLMAGEVAALRRFRDTYLRTNVPGELLVETYYTFGPALAKLIEPSETLRRAARAALGPAVERASTVSDARLR